MTKPVRIQLSRKKGFRLQEHSRAVNGLEAVKVTRPGEFGSPFRIFKVGAEWWVETSSSGWRFATREEAQAASVRLFSEWVRKPERERLRSRVRVALRGKNAACVCGPDEPCHADVLIEIANRHPGASK